MPPMHLPLGQWDPALLRAADIETSVCIQVARRRR